MNAAGDTLGAWWLLMAVGPGIAIALLVRTCGLPGRQPRTVASWYLVLLTLGTPAHFVASFGPGMALADTYGIGAADYSSWSVPLHVTSGLAVIAAQVRWRGTAPPSSRDLRGARCRSHQDIRNAAASALADNVDRLGE